MDQPPPAGPGDSSRPETIILAPLDAAFIAQSVPTLMQPGGVYPVWIEMRNTGATTWEPVESVPFRLGSQAPSDNTIWGCHRRPLPAPARTGDAVRFSFPVTAPLVPGRFAFQWRMLREGVEWFGAPTDAVMVDVVPADEPAAKALFRLRAENIAVQAARGRADFSRSGPADISVVMVVHDNLALTVQTVLSLRQNFAGAIELIVVDSGSAGGTGFLDGHLHGAEILRFPTNIGFVPGCNAALPRTTGRAVLLLNNDVDLAPGAVQAALARLDSDPTIGAVGGKLVRSHGFLQEAGCIVWSDGITEGYLRGESALAPEANFVRDVDFCSAAFLLVGGDLLRRLGGFDPAFAPGYYEDADLCARIRQAGYRVVYDPAVVVHHLEYGSADPTEDVSASIVRHRDRFAQKHRLWLETRPDRQRVSTVIARSAPDHRRGKRILFIDDTVPLRKYGSGYTRSNDIVREMVGVGHCVTVFPVAHCEDPVAEILANFPDTVEVMHDSSLAGLPAFADARAGCYDVIWIVRTHNLDRIAGLWRDGEFPSCIAPTLVLDTEAVAVLRDEERARWSATLRRPCREPALAAEFRNIGLCHHAVAVSGAEAEILRAAGARRVSVVGHVHRAEPTPTSWKDRNGMLFLGAMHDVSSPNVDALSWFVEDVLPLVERRLGWRTRLTVAGYRALGVDLSRFAGHRRITLAPPLWDIAPLFGRHRVFVAPTRFASGIPHKVHTAAAYGLPVAATPLLSRQLGWTAGVDLLCADPGDPARFADAVVQLHETESLWQDIRREALGRIRAENDSAAYRRALGDVLESGEAPPHHAAAASSESGL